MNTEIIIHPKLQHFGLNTANVEPMLTWYRKVLGMTVNYGMKPPANAPWSSVSFLSNDEMNHRISLFEMPGLATDPDKRHHTRVQHVAFEYENLDDLLGTYARLKGIGILPVVAADQIWQTAFYYADPDQNTVELNANNYGDEWTAVEQMKVLPSSPDRPTLVEVDPEKMIATREAGASPLQIHHRALAGEFAPAKPYDWRRFF